MTLSRYIILKLLYSLLNSEFVKYMNNIPSMFDFRFNKTLLLLKNYFLIYSIT